MGYTDTADILAQSHGLGDYPLVAEKKGVQIFDESILTPADYARRASLVLVQVDRNTKSISKPELERALFTGELVSCEVFPAMSSEERYYVRLAEGGPRHRDVGFLKIPSDSSIEQELDRILHTVAELTPEDDSSDSVWGVSHFDSSVFAEETLETIRRMQLYGDDGTPKPERVEETVKEARAQ